MRRGYGWILAAATACGEPSPSALDEPVRVVGASFKEGALPGSAPELPASSPLVTTVETANGIVTQGQSGKAVAGRASTDAVAIGIALHEFGSGYWVFPVEGPDPLANGEFTWDLSLDVSFDAPLGQHPLRVVAIDGQGRAGTQKDIRFCVAPAIPDNLHACDPRIVPPRAVFSLAWDTEVDLDLVVVTPEGRIVDAKHPALDDPKSVGADPAAAIDRDSNAGCVPDGQRRENLVFPSKPRPGSYLVYARLFDACGAAPVHFHFVVVEPDGANGNDPTVTLARDGWLTSFDARGGADIGTFVAEVAF